MKYTKAFINTCYVTVDTPKNVVSERKTSTESTTDNAENSLPLLLMRKRLHSIEDAGECEKRNVYLKCKQWPQRLVLPDNTDAAYYATEPLSGLFGSLNEHEFSSNIWFLNPRLKDTVYLEDGRNSIRHIFRHYYEDECTIFYDAQKMSTQYFDNCSEFTTKSIVRVDSDTTSDNVCVSVKLRVCRLKFNWANKTTLVLSRAIELPMLGWNFADGGVPSIKATKSRRIVFWGVTLTHRGTSYLFRVAFRHGLSAVHEHVECNIECEDPINGDLFGHMFYALYKYYLHQYETQERSIYPVIDNHELFQQSYHYIVDLTEDQRRIINTLRLVAWPTNNTEADTTSINPSVAEFVTYLGICTYANFSDDTTGVDYDALFQHIKFHESKEFRCNDDNTVSWVPCDEAFID